MADNKQKFQICLAQGQMAYAKVLAEVVSIINFLFDHIEIQFPPSKLVLTSIKMA